MTSDRYSRLISWLKVLFPLMALALLSTLFLLSRAIDPEAQIPFADKEIKDRLRDQQVTGPFFTGTTANGDQITFSAEKLTTPEGQTGVNEAESIEAIVDLASGPKITLSARRASFDLAGDQAVLSGDILIETSTGYRISSDMLMFQLSSLDLESPGPVDGITPAGTLHAGSMQLTTPKDSDSAQLIFTNGVKLIYTPKSSKE